MIATPLEAGRELAPYAAHSATSRAATPRIRQRIGPNSSATATA